MNQYATEPGEATFEAEDVYAELLIGCGTRRDKEITYPPDAEKAWQSLTTLDIAESAAPDVVHDLETLPYPFNDNSFNEIHAYEVLEHTGTQGDLAFFFNQFDEFWRILKPGGMFCCSVPMWDSAWAWADPGHKRVIAQASLIFLEREKYENRTDDSPMADYRHMFKGDWKVLGVQETDDRFYFVMQAIK